MDSNTTIAQLIEMGLTEREAKVYRVLLGVSEITAAAIPKFTDIPRTKVYEALSSLVRKGFCKEVPSSEGSGQNGQTFAAVSPEVALEGLMTIEKKRMQHLEELNATLTRELLSMYNNSTSRLQDYNFIEILRGRHEIIRRYTQMRNESKTEILELSPGDFTMTTEEANSEADANELLIRKGVSIKVIYERKEILSGENEYFHTKNKEAGVEARMVDYLPIKISLFDGTTVMLPLSDPIVAEPNLTVLIIEHRNLYRVLRDAFESYWAKGESVEAPIQ